MPRKPCRFRQRDVTKAIKAVAAAGIALDSIRVEIGEDGKIVIYTIPASGDPTRGDLDTWLQQHAR